jgi:hypothetical protein
MYRFPLSCVTLLLLMVSSTLSQDVSYKFDDKADFSKFKTYTWVYFQNVAPIDKLTDQQIKAAVDTVLAQKALMKVDGASNADLFIGYQTNEFIDEQFAKTPTSDASPRTIYSGKLSIGMYTTNHHLVWSGVASKTLDPKANAQKRQKNLNKAVAKLMKNYPPAKGG